MKTPKQDTALEQPATIPRITLYGLEPSEQTEHVTFVTVTMQGEKVIDVTRSEPMTIPMALMTLRHNGAQKWLLKR